MFTTIKNSHTRISKQVIVNKIHNFDNLYSMENIPYTINVEITAEPGEPKPDQKEINIVHSLNYHKINFLLETIINESYLVTPASAEHLLNLFSESDNNVSLSPDGGEASLGVMLHAKINTITTDSFIGGVEIIDNRTNTCYTYYDDENEYAPLPSIQEMILENGLAFHDQPWWFRNDISTYDGCAKDETEYNHYLENHFEKVQEAVKQPLLELDEKLREAMLDNKDPGEVIDLEEFKKKKSWKPKLI